MHSLEVRFARLPYAPSNEFQKLNRASKNNGFVFRQRMPAKAFGDAFHRLMAVCFARSSAAHHGRRAIE
ncbi:hypothetical protein MPC4_190021 [Methylocella tundrae]|uniref:Uncharacterized protein n=1 Tax=Methylocella tundrae TaxID=227605 RepID=A0A8B6M4D9_METTU|nr:hypothetical protein MPC4_190021 [Methylocella tundrae]